MQLQGIMDNKFSRVKMASDDQHQAVKVYISTVQTLMIKWKDLKWARCSQEWSLMVVIWNKAKRYLCEQNNNGRIVKSSCLLVICWGKIGQIRRRWYDWRKYLYEVHTHFRMVFKYLVFQFLYLQEHYIQISEFRSHNTLDVY